ncbi:hypothetical protein GALL_542210 [mine drainage metagenome]|uniref:Uncharacterized protein n=1 Tax=mine drainage metagenome TaxID=410659 RepID=A0A1J5NZH0_9ZZZZ
MPFARLAERAHPHFPAPLRRGFFVLLIIFTSAGVMKNEEGWAYHAVLPH